jgi:hypothetical protein
MATPRKRSPSSQTSGFGVESIKETSNVSEKEEQENLEEFQEVTAKEVFEMIELAEEKVETAPFFEECIVATEDPGFQFVETPELAASAPPPAATWSGCRHPSSVAHYPESAARYRHPPRRRARHP